MKSLFITLTIFSSSLFTTAFANEGKTSPNAIASFESTFTGATEISWKNLGAISKVSFTVDGICTAAYYNTDGDLVATTRNISSSELPSQLRKGLLKELKNHWITELFVMTTTEGSTYYVNLEDANTKVVMKSANGKKWTVDQITTK